VKIEAKPGCQCLEKMRTVPGLVEVNSNASLVQPEILIIPDPARAADLGVTVQAIARTASLATIGDNEANLAKFNLPTAKYRFGFRSPHGVMILTRLEIFGCQVKK